MDWIDVNERLPEKHQTVIATDGNEVGEYIFFGAKGGYYFETDEGYSIDVTHWMPLPKRPGKE